MAVTMPGIDQLPAGPRRALVQALHDLYRDAGKPGIRVVSAAIRARNELPDTVSHEAVRAMLRGEGIPRWSKLESLVRQLADWAVHRPVSSEVVQRFHSLWLAASDGVEAGPVLGDQRDDGRYIESGGQPLPSSLDISASSALAGYRESIGNDQEVQFGEESPPSGRSADWWTFTGGPVVVVEQEIADVSYVGKWYECRISRTVLNSGIEPITRYPVRISVDRYPGDLERSYRYYRENPLILDEMNLSACCSGELMQWSARGDLDSVKELWLLFQNGHGWFPLYPGQRADIEYKFRVGDDKWGPFFVRGVGSPTGRLVIRVDLPGVLDPMVWGDEISEFGGVSPLRTPIDVRSEGDRRIFIWETNSPRQYHSYRLAWHFRGSMP